MEISDMIIAEHDRLFGKGSWDKMEAEVKARHPELSWIWEEDAAEEEHPKRWWQFWK